MPDITDLSISELTPVASAADTDLFETSEVDGTDPSGYVSKRISLGVIADFIGRIFRFPSALTTTDKTIVGAINEVKADAGSDVSVTNTIPSSDETKRVATVTIDETPTDINADDTEAILRRVFGEHTVEGNPVTFDAYLGLETVKSMTLTMNPKQSGTGDPSPTNIRPISGRDSVDVVVTGVNQWDEEWEHKRGYSTGQMLNSDSNLASKNFIKVFPSAFYYLVIPSTFDGFLYQYDSEQNFISGQRLKTSGLISVGDNTNYIKFASNNDAFTDGYDNNISINYPSTDTEYHAYNGQTKTITFPSTIYGGTDEVTGGNGTKINKLLAFNDLALVKHASGCFYAPIDDKARVNTGLFCSCFNPLNGNNYSTSTILNEPNGSIGQNSGNKSIYIRADEYATVEDFKTAFGTQTLLYTLETPTPFSTTPTPIPLNKGNNVVSTDADDLELTYSVG